jgi:methanogenic corrinoid protein MtbC1
MHTDHDCQTLSSVGMHGLERDGWTGQDPPPVSAKERLARLARTIETDVIPRLVLNHRSPGAQAAAAAAAAAAARESIQLGEHDVVRFVGQILNETESQVIAALQLHRQRGLSVEGIYLQLLGPAARHLGELWEDDLCDFSTVTIALGRLQRLLREMSPDFGREVDHPPHGRRIMFVQPRDEQHSFGLSMVAEFFRRDGWDVIGGVGGTVADPAGTVRSEWVDVIGFSIGSESRLPWLSSCITAVRAASCNKHLRVMAGGPILALHPQWAATAGADATAQNGKEAPGVAESLLMTVSMRP